MSSEAKNRILCPFLQLFEWIIISAVDQKADIYILNAAGAEVKKAITSL